MRALESKTGLRTGTWLLLVANALPIAGLFAFGWRPFQALFVYWVEIGVTLLGYFVLVSFGQRESRPDEKGGASFPGPLPLPAPDGSVRPFRSLPPLRYRNVRYVPAAVPLVAICWVFLSRAFLDFSNPGVVLDGARSAAGSMFGYVVVAYTPEGLALAGLTSSIHLFSIGRDYLSRRLVDEYSAAMLLEIPVRVAAVWFGLTFLLVPAHVAAAAGGVDSPLVGWFFLVVLLGLKLAVDRTLVRLRYDPDPGPLTRIFVPNERETEGPARTEGTADDLGG